MTDANDVLTIKFKSIMSMENVAELYDELRGTLDQSPKKIVFDCSVNEEIDFASLQTLVAYYKQRTGTGTKVVWDNPSIALFERSVELGMDEALGL